MSDGEEVIIRMEIGKADLRIEDLDMSMDQDFPWRDAFELKDLKLLFNREIEEDNDSYIKEDLSFGDRSMSVDDLTIGKLSADLEDVRVHLEDSTGSVDLKSEKQEVSLKNLEASNLKLLLDEATVDKSVTYRLVGCDFGIKMFPPSAGLSCVDKAFMRLDNVVLTFIFQEEKMEGVGGDVYFEGIDASGRDSSLLDLDVGEEDVDMEGVGKRWPSVFLEGEDFDFDLGDMVFYFERLRVNKGESSSLDLSFEDYERNFRDLIGNLKGLVDEGLKIVKEKSDS